MRSSFFYPLPLAAVVLIAIVDALSTHTGTIAVNEQHGALDRRTFWKAGAGLVFAAGTAIGTIGSNPSPAYALPKESANTLIFQQDKQVPLSAQVAKERFVLARTDLQYLLDNFGDITRSGGGDAVRNYLGTQGVNSGMYGIQKVLKRLQNEADDIVEYTETMEEFNAYLYQAEGAAYQSMFAEHSSSKSTPQSLLATAKQDVAQMMKYMNQLGVQLDL